jgi:nucleotide-binding universal stress UspA family protein
MTASRYKKIVVPLDGSGWSEAALPHAIDIARANNSEVILLHVFRPPAHEFIDVIAIAGQDQQLQAAREASKQKFMSLRNELRDQGIDARVQWVEGVNVADLVCEYIAFEDADLVVMTSHGYTGLAKLLFGSVANEVIHRVNVPVMIIHPGK